MLTCLHNLGYKLTYLDSTLEELDMFYDIYYPELNTLSRQSAEEWIYYIKTNSRHVLAQRVTTIKYLGKYLNSIGMEAYVPDYGIALGPHKHSLLLDDNQLLRFFDGADHINHDLRSPHREYIIPVIFRLIYSCGLRNSEACHIKMNHIHLETGRIDIYQSKGSKDRSLLMDETMTKLCIEFNTVYSMILPDREYFFQPSYEKICLTTYNVDDHFDRILKITGLDKEFPRKPTVHGLRHLFAVKSMKKCLALGQSFENWITYLSCYMGHESVKETMYYLHMVEALVPEYRVKMKSLTEGIGDVYEED
jgi:integrase